MAISDETRLIWDAKLKIIKEAREIGIVLIYPNEISFLKGMELKRKHDKDLTHRESKYINRIFERIR